MRSDLIPVVRTSRSDSGAGCLMQSVERRRILSVKYQMRLQWRQSQELREVKLLMDIDCGVGRHLHLS